MRIRKLIVMARVDYVTFALVVLDMVVKPTGDDGGVLIAMALILAAGIGYILVSLRSDRRAGGAALERLGQDQVAVAELVEAIAGGPRGVV